MVDLRRNDPYKKPTPIGEVEMEAVTANVITELATSVENARKNGSLMAKNDPDLYCLVVCELAKSASLKDASKKCGVSLAFAARVKVEAALEINRIREAFAFDAAQFALMSQTVVMEALTAFYDNMQKFEEENPGERFPVAAKDLAQLMQAHERISRMPQLDHLLVAKQTGAQTEDEVMNERLERAKELRQSLQEEVINI